MALDIHNFIKAIEGTVGHSNLFALVYEGCAAKGKEKSEKHLRAHSAVFSALGKASDRARLVVVFKIQSVPVKPCLPLRQNFHKPFRLKFGFEPFYGYLVALHMLEGEYHIKLTARLVAKVTRHRNIYHNRFTYGEGVVLIHNVTAEGGEYSVGAVGGEIMLSARKDKLTLAVLEALFVYDVYNVAAEACHALIKPEAHNIAYFAVDLRIIPVKVGLLFREEVEKILLVFGVAEGLPGAVGEEVAPIVGELAVLALLDYIVILVFFLACEGSFEPFVLVGGVVDYKVHYYGDAARLCLGEKLVKVSHSAELGLNIPVVGDVVAVIVVGAFVDGGKPDNVYSKLREVIKLRDYASDISNTVSVGVSEGARVYLIYC